MMAVRPHLLAAVGAVCALAAAVVAAGCSTAVTSPSASPTASSARITISPQDGLQTAKPHHGIEVTVEDGTLLTVSVKTKGDPVNGAMNADSTAWRSRWTLSTDTRYSVRATAVDAKGRKVTATSTFRTFAPHTTTSVQIFEGSHQTYGVGMPVILTFSRPVEDRKAVERALVLKCSKRVVGAWYWDGDQALYFRPRSYWPAHCRITFAGHLDGVQISPGVFATHTLRQTFFIGRSLISVASTRTHHILVYRDRKLFADWPISTGKSGHDTPNGTYLSIQKENPAHMVGDDYDLMVPYAVRIMWSGIFLHAASWSVSEQGHTNVSHGCVNLSPASAQTYYRMSVPGDPVTITGSPKEGTWDDGWTVWFLSWRQLVQGSAFHKAVRVSPDGSTRVSPSSLKASRAKAPLGRAATGNSASD